MKKRIAYCYGGLLALLSASVWADVSLQFTTLLERHALANGVDITQLGDLNVADVTQSGQGHYAVLLQQGVLNQLSLTQSGFANQAEVSQIGNGNSAQIIQNGSYNLIQLQQWGNRQFTIEQSGVGAEISVIQY
ncbi:MAG: curlin subunit CsgB [Chromatiaceae bacterium]|nr:curlin subunit CsgB [Chromatiaceae bacterium]